MFLKTLDLQQQRRQRQETEAPLQLLKACQDLLMLSWLWDLPRLLWPSPLGMEVSPAWGCWSGPACPVLLRLVNSGAGCIPANRYFRQAEVSAVKTHPKNHWDRSGMPRDLFVPVGVITSDVEQLPTSAWCVLVLVRKTLLLEWAGKLGVLKQVLVLFWAHWGEQWGCTTHCSQRPAHWVSSFPPPELCQRVCS